MDSITKMEKIVEEFKELPQMWRMDLLEKLAKIVKKNFVSSDDLEKLDDYEHYKNRCEDLELENDDLRNKIEELGGGE